MAITRSAVSISKLRADLTGDVIGLDDAVEHRYDPTNVFRLHQHIPPTAEGSP